MSSQSSKKQMQERRFKPCLMPGAWLYVCWTLPLSSSSKATRTNPELRVLLVGGCIELCILWAWDGLEGSCGEGVMLECPALCPLAERLPLCISVPVSGREEGRKDKQMGAYRWERHQREAGVGRWNRPGQDRPGQARPGPRYTEESAIAGLVYRRTPILTLLCYLTSLSRRAKVAM